MVSLVSQGRVLGLQLFLLYTAEIFSFLGNKHYGHADTTLVAVVPSTGERETVTESLNRDLNRFVYGVTCPE